MHAPAPRPRRSKPPARAGLAALALSLAALAQGGAAAAQRRFPFPLPGANRGATPFELAIARGDRALGEGRLDDAAAEFERARGLDARDARPAFYLGEVAARRQRWAEAEGLFAEAVARNPSMAEAHAERALALRELRRDDEALAALQTATRLDPSLAEARLSLAMLLDDRGEAERATSEYRAALRLAPESAQAALNLGLLLANARPPAGTQPRAEALRMLSTAVRNARGDRAVLAAAGPGLRLLGEHALAVDALERAVAPGPAAPATAGAAAGAGPSAAVLVELAQALWAAGRRDDALRRCDEAVAADANAPEVRYVRALMRAEARHEGAAEDLREVLRRAPEGPLAARARAVLERLGAGRARGPAHSSPSSPRIVHPKGVGAAAYLLAGPVVVPGGTTR